VLHPAARHGPLPDPVDEEERVGCPPYAKALTCRSSTGPTLEKSSYEISVSADSSHPTTKKIVYVSSIAWLGVTAACRVAHVRRGGAGAGLVSVYGPEPLNKPADGNVLVCCSQPIHDVVIDL